MFNLFRKISLSWFLSFPKNISCKTLFSEWSLLYNILISVRYVLLIFSFLVPIYRVWPIKLPATNPGCKNWKAVKNHKSRFWKKLTSRKSKWKQISSTTWRSFIEEQEGKIDELEKRIKGENPASSPYNSKVSSIKKLVDSINDLHTEKSRIHEMWLSTQSDLETIKQ